MDRDDSIKLMNGYIAILGSQWITYVVAMLSTAYITRVLGPDDYAKFIQMQFVTGTFYTVFNLSISSAVSRFAAEHAAKGEMSLASGVLRVGLKITIVAGAAASVIMLLFSNQLAGTLLGDVGAGQLIKLLAISTGLTIITSPLISYVYALQKFRVYSLITVINATFWRGSLIIALLLGTGLYGISLAWMAECIIVSMVITIPILRMAGKAETYPSFQLFSYSMPLVISTYLGFLSQWIDSLFIPYVGSMRLLGMVSIAGTLTNLTLILINSASTVLFTHFVRIDAIDGREALLEAGQKISRLLTYCFVPLGFLVGAMSDLLVLIYAGEAFLPASLIIKLMSPYMTVGAVLFVIWTNEVTTIGKTKLLLFNTIASLISYVVIGVLLVPSLGVLGYVLSKVSGIIVFPYIWKKTKALISIRFDFKALVLSALVSTVIILPATIIEILTSNYLLISIASILGTVCYVLVVIKGGLLSKNEMRILLKLVTQNFKFNKKFEKLNSQASVQSTKLGTGSRSIRR